MRTLIEKLRNTYPVSDNTRKKLGEIILKEIRSEPVEFINWLNKKETDSELLAVALHFNVPNFDEILNAFEAEHGFKINTK